jgi:hypothetical protein
MHFMPGLAARHEEERFLAAPRLCENTVHGSTRLTTNGVVS